MKLYAGIDLHSNNSYLFIIDEHDQKILSKRLPNDLEVVIQTLEPFEYALTGIVVESTYNWYWLVDGLIANNYTVHLANTTQIQQYNGLKSTNDKTDAFWLAHLLRLDLLAEGYIHPLSERGLRELVRRRCHLVQQQTSNLLSLQGIITRYTGKKISANRIKQLSKDTLLDYLQEKHVYTAAKGHLIILNTLLNEICVIEQQMLLQMKSNTTFKYLQTIPGIGSILGSVIVLETGSIIRFNNAGCFASYCRCVKSIRSSNNQEEGRK